jgi:hypothetical protein
VGRLGSERGGALVLSLMAMTILMAFGAALIVITSTEALIARNFVSAREAAYAAEAIVELAVAELRTGVDWAAVLEGAQASRFVDPAPAPIDLAAVPNLANCGAPSGCAGPPAWRLFAYGPLGSFLLLPVAESPFYVVALVAPVEGDAAVPGLRVRGEAFGPRGAFRALELTLLAGADGRSRTAAAGFVP